MIKKFKTMEEKIKNKKGIEMDMMIYWFIALAVLVLGALIAFYVSKSGTGLLSTIKNMFQFGR